MSNKAAGKQEAKPALTPKLRFPEFDTSWTHEPLSTVLKEYKIKNTAGRDVFSVSMERGVVNQIAHLGRSFAASDTAHYTVGRRFDVVYTKSPLKAFPFGVVKQCKFKGEVALSPLYGVFTPLNPHIGLMVEAYFESPNRSKAFLSPLCQKGAKNTLQITNNTFLSGRLPLPKQPAEQQKIAECLTTLDELISAQSQKLDALKTHKKGLMQQLFPLEGETLPRLRFPEFKDAPEWVNDSLGALSQVVRGGSPRPIDGFLTTAADALNWLKIGDVDKESKYVTRTSEKVRLEALSKTRVVNSGDLILSNSMSFGRPYILRITTCIHDGWIAITNIASRIDLDFLYYCILAPDSQSYFVTNAAGSGVQNLNAEIIKALPICCPSISEQHRIATCLTTLDDLISAQSAKLSALKTHKKGLMQQLFPIPD